MAFDAVLNKTYKDQKEELSADAGEIIQDVQGAGEEVAFSAVIVLRCKNRLETLRIRSEGFFILGVDEPIRTEDFELVNIMTNIFLQKSASIKQTENDLCKNSQRLANIFNNCRKTLICQIGQFGKFDEI